MNNQYSGLTNLMNMNNGARARYNYAKLFFQGHSPSIHSNIKDTIEQHQAWFRQQLQQFGLGEDIDMDHVGYFGPPKSQGLPKPKIHFWQLQRQAEESAGNILNAMLWYLFPQYSSWHRLSLKIRNPNLVLYENNEAHRNEHHEKIQKPTSGQTDEIERQPTFTLVKRDSGSVSKGHIDFTNSTVARHGIIESDFHPDKGLLLVNFGSGIPYTAWYPMKDGQFVYRLEYVRQFLTKLKQEMESGLEGIIRIESSRI